MEDCLHLGEPEESGPVLKDCKIVSSPNHILLCCELPVKRHLLRLRRKRTNDEHMPITEARTR